MKWNWKIYVRQCLSRMRAQSPFPYQKGLTRLYYDEMAIFCIIYLMCLNKLIALVRSRVIMRSWLWRVWASVYEKGYPCNILAVPIHDILKVSNPHYYYGHTTRSHTIKTENKIPLEVDHKKWIIKWKDGWLRT